MPRRLHAALIILCCLPWWLAAAAEDAPRTVPQAEPLAAATETATPIRDAGTLAQVPAATVLAIRHEMTFSRFPEIPRLAGATIPQLEREARRLGAKRAGGMRFIYTFIDDPTGPDRPDGRFTLDIALPVATAEGTPTTGSYLKIPAVAVLTVTRHGPFSFSQEWSDLRTQAATRGLARTLVEEEVYHAWHGGPENPRTVVEFRIHITSPAPQAQTAP